VIRYEGFDGNITVTWQILNGTTATEGADFEIDSDPMIFIGDTPGQETRL
jgi:hypothetical protein